MATDLNETTAPITIADLLQRLGGIAPRRVRMVPAPGTATEADVLAIEARCNRLFELVDGVLVEKVMGYPESVLTMALCSLIWNFVKKHKRGVVAGPDGMLRLSSRMIRIPDISFVSWDRLPGRKVPKKPIPHLAPNLAVEVWSKGNTKKEMSIKRRGYFKAGVIRVWEVDPRTRTITVYSDPKNCEIYRHGQVLDGAPVLPGFKLVLADLFAELNESAS